MTQSEQALAEADVVIELDHVSKTYTLGTFGHGTLYRDLQSWWARVRGRPDPNAKIFSSSAPLPKDSAPRKFAALNDVSLRIKRGDVVGVIGRNGAGKSTLLKLLSRITAPTTGAIRMKGRVASLLEVGTGFHSELTGRENVYLNGAILGMTRAEVDRKFDEIIEFSELRTFIDTPVKRYSSGMIVRLAFAVAAHLDAEILIVDEVLAVGDAAFRKKCLGKMQGLAREHARTILFVSHDMGAVRSLCTRGVVLHHGAIVFDSDIAAAAMYYGDLNTRAVENSGVFLLDKNNGNFPVHIAKVELRDDTGQTASRFKSGSGMEIRVDLEGEPPQNGFNLEWRLKSFRGEQLAFGASYALGGKTYRIEDKSMICDIDTLPLAAGEYYFTLMLRVWQQEAWQYVEQAASFEIDVLPHSESGFVYELVNSGPIRIEQGWR